MEEVKSALINKKRIFAFRTREQFLDFINEERKILVALNAEKLTKEEEQLTKLINTNIGYPDGIGAVLALKRKGIKAIKIPGAEFWLDIIERYQKSKSFYLIGATQEVMDLTVRKLQVEFPEIKLAGFRNGFLKEGDTQKLIADFQSAKPDVVFVAMGSPKQEFLMAEFSKAYPCLYMGLGGSFDVYSGHKKRAPIAYQKLGLEWFYRLVKEPTRISRQLNLVKFFFKIIFGRL